MSFKKISVPALRINDELIKIVPNSCSYDGGEVEITVEAASAGSGTIESVHAENAETGIGMVKFSVFLDNDLDGKIRDWKSAVAANVIKMTQDNVNGAAFIRVFPGQSLMGKVERNPSADGTVELEFSGDQMII